ncbi:MAG: hypothetical protein ACLQNV_20980, partial [Steroidobacteraceae bacterium]
GISGRFASDYAHFAPHCFPVELLLRLIRPRTINGSRVGSNLETSRLLVVRLFASPPRYLPFAPRARVLFMAANFAKLLELVGGTVEDCCELSPTSLISSVDRWRQTSGKN